MPTINTVKLAIIIKLLIHYTKGTIFFSMWFLFFLFQIFSLLFRSLFHLSFTVLVHYRLILYIIKFEDGSPFFIQIVYRITFIFKFSVRTYYIALQAQANGTKALYTGLSPSLVLYNLSARSSPAPPPTRLNVAIII